MTEARPLTDEERRAIGRRLFYEGRYVVRQRGRGEEADVLEWDEEVSAYGWIRDFDDIYAAERWIKNQEQYE